MATRWVEVIPIFYRTSEASFQRPEAYGGAPDTHLGSLMPRSVPRCGLVAALRVVEQVAQEVAQKAGDQGGKRVHADLRVGEGAADAEGGGDGGVRALAAQQVADD